LQRIPVAVEALQPVEPPARAGLERLELRLERLQMTFRFTYAFHAREVRFERDTGQGFERVFPETFSFHAERHDPAELYLQLDDLARKPQLLAPRANPRDANVLVSRLTLGVPRYLERLLDRLEAEGLDDAALCRIYEDVALLAQIMTRFVADPEGEQRQGMRMAGFHLRKLIFRALQELSLRRVEPEYREAYVRGAVDPVDPADDLSDSGFFYTLESGEPSAVNRVLMRLTERAFYRWLEDICLDEDNRAFELEDSPFLDRESEVRYALSRAPREEIRRAGNLTAFLRRPDNRDCLRVLGKLSSWFLRQYDIHHAAVMIHHQEDMRRGRVDGERVLSRHNTRNYLLTLFAGMAPFIAAIFAYERAPRVFDVLCSAELAIVGIGVVWFLLYRFCWRRDLTFFHASVPRIAAGIIVGYLPIFFIDEVWGLASRSWALLGSVAMLLGFTTLLYLYVEVQRKLGDVDLAFSRARQIFLLGVVQSFGAGLVITGLTGGYMASRNWAASELPVPVETLRDTLPTFLGQLPKIVGLEPLYVFPAAVFVMTFMAFFIGTFLQLLWEDIPITEPL
jgi:hypothetical protein